MEKITFTYKIGENNSTEITVNKSAKNFLTADEICDAFTDLMQALGFPIERIQEYYKV